ncbi:MATE efflux family protein [Treponema maltophilum ATCC 51939]|uniref:Multidrug export protein MepA n=1 Tax=Treponema maltophilum ATCC 51939 TaxID=1125699 RepID=S3JYK9_TREMA|nr:MATE family efflux transporter [Treponema maltophilum]EPF31093.1 MATE efflux family protein [Treponema maltophilum ATCC 51939]
MTDEREELTSGNMFKLMLKLGIPGIIGMLVISLYSFVDAIFVGRYVGDKALGAISIAYAFTLINNGIAVLVGIGSASVLSRAVGRKDQKTIDSVMGNVFVLTLLMSSVVTVLGYIFAPQLLHVVRAEGEMHELGVKYLRIVYLGSIFVNFGQAANMVMRGEGKMALAMAIMGSGAVLNIVLDALFIIVFKQGIEGAAIATVISQAVFALATFFYFLCFSKNIKFKSFKLEKSLVGETFAVGMSAMFMQVLSLVQQTVMYSTLKKYGGEDQVILMGAFFRYMMLAFIPLWGLSQGFQPFAGTNFGAGLFERVKKGTFLFYGFGVVLAAVFWIVFLASPESVLSLFIKDNPALVAAGKTNATLAFLIFPLMPIMILNITLFQALGKAKPAGFLAISRQLVLFVPAVLILPHFLGVRGVWAAGLFVDGLLVIISIIITARIFAKDLSAKAH